ncbi:Long chain acyl-CoA synthetase 6, peroxisomal [Vitis vinifera]|uniref:Long chain acyl-CoA synthetase 6, peroxisomal n=1 Tax=Vitis vinifera TaxID=29760 RepID=A0A438F606_VITVI|nr:Long chain acyl-CoA synthetase 6, peroxisomal [Vitis vinifera]
MDNLKLMDDMAALRPTIFCSVPRLYNRIYAGIKYFDWLLCLLQHYKCCKDIWCLRERLFNAAYNAKKRAYEW